MQPEMVKPIAYTDKDVRTIEREESLEGYGSF